MAAFHDKSSPITKSRKTLNIVYSEESVKERRERVKGLGSLSQLEVIHIVSAGNVLVPEKQRLKYDGSNRGDTITGVHLLSPKSPEVWCKTVEHKKNSMALGLSRTEAHAPADLKGPHARPPTWSLFSGMPSRQTCCTNCSTPSICAVRLI